MTTLETLKWDGKKSGKVSLDLAVAKETSSADLIHRAVLRPVSYTHLTLPTKRIV